jgi:hypothetical protein
VTRRRSVRCRPSPWRRACRTARGSCRGCGRGRARQHPLGKRENRFPHEPCRKYQSMCLHGNRLTQTELRFARRSLPVRRQLEAAGGHLALSVGCQFGPVVQRLLRPPVAWPRKLPSRGPQVRALPGVPTQVVSTAIYKYKLDLREPPRSLCGDNRRPLAATSRCQSFVSLGRWSIPASREVQRRPSCNRRLLHSRDAFRGSSTSGPWGKWVGVRPSWQGIRCLSWSVGVCLPVARRRSLSQARPRARCSRLRPEAIRENRAALRVAPRLPEAYLARAQLTRTARNRFPHELPSRIARSELALGTRRSRRKIMGWVLSPVPRQSNWLRRQ